MARKSLFTQIESCAVPTARLLPSPRYQNPGLLRYRGKLWLGYRYHRMETPTARCGIGMCEINPDTAEPLNDGQRLEIPNPTNGEHHEDCRLFMFRGEPFISYTEMVGYIPGVNYTCVIKYARLKLIKDKWTVLTQWKPKYGNNTGFAKEKNWIFFEKDDQLYCIYASSPEHLVIRMDNGKVVEEFISPGAAWPWGTVRGGTPPVDLGDGRMMVIFHSSIPTEEPPHYVRYFAGAYTFESKPPFRILQISQWPVLASCLEDGHANDPRFPQGWKPCVVFPCGLVTDGDSWLVSFGVNDWRCGVGRLKTSDLHLGELNGSSFEPRYYYVPNGTIPVRYVEAPNHVSFIHWEIGAPGRGCSSSPGYLKITKAREALEVEEHPLVEVITEEQYLNGTKRLERVKGDIRNSRARSGTPARMM